MKHYYIPKHARDKAWAYCLASAEVAPGEKPTILVRIVNGMTGEVIRDKHYQKRPATARCSFTKYDDDGWVSPLRWEMVH